MSVLPESASRAEIVRAERELAQIAWDKAPGSTHGVGINDSVVDEIARKASDCDLAVVGQKRPNRRYRTFGELALQVARNTPCATIMLGQNV